MPFSLSYIHCDPKNVSSEGAIMESAKCSKFDTELLHVRRNGNYSRLESGTIVSSTMSECCDICAILLS